MLSRQERFLTLAIFVLIAIITLYPLAVLVSTSLEPVNSTTTSSISFSHPLSVAAYGYAWHTGNFSTYMINTAIVTVSVMAISAVVAILAAYGIERLRPPGGRIVLYISALGFMLPVETLVIAWYYQFESLGWLNSYWAMILPQVAQSVAFGTFWLATAFRGLPRSLTEAAIIDGTSRWALLWRVLVPSVAPAIRTMMALVFLWTWNSFLLPLVVEANSSRYTVTVGLSTFQGAHGNSYSALAAGSVLAALPVVLVFLYSQRSFIAGMFAGASVE
ncbi:MAG TPA: carbohydrate ABC transporter permease [Acidimicrobiales bacterium]|nr:carbohydrate ABC transporter permease [Acidimicrobiales bacterium]